MYKIEKIIKYAKDHGLLGLFKAGIRRFIFRWEKKVVTCISLAEPLPAVQSLQDITIRKATLTDVDELHKLIAGDNWPHYRKEIGDWIAKGYPVLLSLAGDKIVGYVCISYEFPPKHPLFGKVINLQDADAFGADAFVLPAYRGKNIYPVLVSEALKCTAGAGYQRVLGEIFLTNLASRSSHQKIGCKEMKEIKFIKILFFKRISVKSLIEEREDA